MNKVICYTLFDCTATGILNHAKVTQLPLTDKQGAVITDQTALTRARNQQRNWETLTQLISLRTQVTIYSEPQILQDASVAMLGLNRRSSRIWTFEFGSEFASIYDISGEPLAALTQDCDGVPLITGLGEAVENLEPVIRTTGAVINTKFVYQ
jgi:hypothetical protein